jgi:hypothetical protein
MIVTILRHHAGTASAPQLAAIRRARTWSREARKAALLGALALALMGMNVSTATATECPNEQLRQENNSTNLPDCRAYEQVSPVEKDGGSGGVSGITGEGTAGEALPDGEAITYAGEPFFHAEGPLAQAYTSRRSATGWITQHGDTLSPELVPQPALPTVAIGTDALILEETADGSKVFFLDEAELLPGISNAAEGEPDLYEYELPTPAHPQGQLTDLTVDETEHPDVQGTVGIGGEGNEEGSYIYFIAGGKLTPNAPTGTCGEQNGKQGDQDGATGTGCKLYLHHNDTTTFIATLDPEDEAGLHGVVGLAARRGSLFDWIVTPSDRTTEVSPNGRYVTFGSRKELTGQPAEPFAVEEEGGTIEVIPAAEIFRYSVEAEEKHEQSIVCVSCDPGSVAKNSVPFSSGAINGAGRSRYMLDNGRVLFTTSAALVSQDINHQPDLYEYEPEGVGSCTSASSTTGSRFIPEELGCVSLISGGTSEANPDVAFADVSSDGSNIFFVTSQSLVPEDTDEINDMYDAREDGGFPLPPAPACPTEASCPSPFEAPTNQGPPTSASSTGTEAVPPLLNLEPKPVPPSKPLSKTQKLIKALKQCRKELRSEAKRRSSCEKQARARYRPKGAAPKSKKKGSK